MAAPKTVLLGKKELRDWWLSVVKKNEFMEVMALVTAEMVHSHKVSMEEVLGAKLLQETMMTIADVDTPLAEMPGPGIEHDLRAIKEADKNQ